jgi:hypothetical protein
MAQERQQHRQDMDTGMGLIKSGKYYTDIPNEIVSRLSPRSKEALRQQEKLYWTHQTPETDFATASYLLGTSEAEFKRRVLAEDLPFLSPTSQTIFTGIQLSLNSTDAREQARGRTYLKAMQVVNQNLSAGGKAFLPSDDFDAVYMQALVATEKIFKEAGGVTQAQLNAVLGPIILGQFDTVSGHTRAMIRGQKDAKASGFSASMTAMAQEAHVPLQFMPALISDFRKEHQRTPTVVELPALYSKNEAKYYKKITSHSLEDVQAVLDEIRASGRSVTYGGVIAALQRLPKSDPHEGF